MNSYYKYAVLGCFLLAIDQITKYLVRMYNPKINMLIFDLVFLQNNGAVFGSFRGTNSIMIWVTFIAIGVVLFYWDKLPNTKLSMTMLILILTGAIGNLIDRILFGYITDFIDFRFFPVFNVADMMISIGIVGLIITVIQDELKNKKKK
jgi:signal peptidase II